jgi:ribulose-phosphate 3-epimerase
MITDPLRFLEPLAKAGAGGVTVHIEAVPNPLPVMDEADKLGIDVGLVINPPTPFEAIEPFLDRCSIALVMSVHPGFGGQSFIESVVPKIERLRETIDSHALSADIEVDGGINAHTAVIARAAGADVFVAGTTIFGSDDPVAAVGELRSILAEEVT